MSEEFFSGFRQDIKNKFVSADSITESEKALTVETQQYDPRPLYQRLKEQQAQKDAEMDEAYRLANRIRKLDEEEVTFLHNLDQASQKQNKVIKDQEQVEINKFKQDSESAWTGVKSFKTQKPIEDPQRKLLANSVVLKKDQRSKVVKKVYGATKVTAKLKSLVPMYASSDSD